MSKILNLDEIAPKETLTVVVDGTSHKMRPITVSDYLANMKLIEDLGMNPTMSQEIEASIEMIQRAFPTMKKDELKGWSVERMRMLVEIARDGSGETVTQNKEEIESGNAPKES